jgi:hypothetical protein
MSVYGILPSPSTTRLVVSDIGGTLIPNTDYVQGIKDAAKQFYRGNVPNVDLSTVDKLRKILSGAFFKIRFGNYDAFERVHKMTELAQKHSVEFIEYIGSVWAGFLNQDTINILQRYKDTSSFAILSMEAEQTLGDIFGKLGNEGIDIDRYIVNRLFVDENGVVIEGLGSSSNVPTWDTNNPLDTAEKKLGGFLELVKSYGLDPFDPKHMKRILYVTDQDEKVESAIKEHILRYDGNLYIIPSGD